MCVHEMMSYISGPSLFAPELDKGVILQPFGGQALAHVRMVDFGTISERKIDLYAEGSEGDPFPMNKL